MIAILELVLLNFLFQMLLLLLLLLLCTVKLSFAGQLEKNSLGAGYS